MPDLDRRGLLLALMGLALPILADDPAEARGSRGRRSSGRTRARRGRGRSSRGAYVMGNGNGDASYGSCAQARAAGAAPLRRGRPGYSARLDRDHDGVACE